MALTPVKFLRSAGGYNVDEIAGFRPDRAKALIKAGIAEAYVKPKSKPKPTAAKPEAKDCTDKSPAKTTS